VAASHTVALVVSYTTLCHVPDPDAVLYEAVRILRPGGSLAVFDGDYASGTVNPVTAYPASVSENPPILRLHCA